MWQTHYKTLSLVPYLLKDYRNTSPKIVFSENVKEVEKFVFLYGGQDRIIMASSFVSTCRPIAGKAFLKSTSFYVQFQLHSYSISLKYQQLGKHVVMDIVFYEHRLLFENMLTLKDKSIIFWNKIDLSGNFRYQNHHIFLKKKMVISREQ